VSEIVLSFFLMYVIYGVAVDRRGPAVIAGLAIGLTITMDIFANGAVGGAAMNPSRHFGVALIGNHWSDWWIWYTAPFIGMAIAAFVYVYIHLHGTERPEPA
jgi:glycerol uptake facilitator-like aquaporin